MEWFLVALGGGFGAVLRFSIIHLMSKIRFQLFCATLSVNLLGSFLLGITIHHVLQSSQLYNFFSIGVLGAFTTFSTFAFDIVNLVDEGQWMTASFYIVISLIGGILAFTIGWYI